MTLHSQNVVDTITGLVHAPYAKLSLNYETYATACLDHIPTVRLRNTLRLVTCLGCIAREVPSVDEVREET